MMEVQTTQFILVMITAPSEESAREIAQMLLEKKLAACVNLVPAIRSLYIWDGAANDDNEVLMIVKSRAALFEHQLVPAVQQLHLYEVPEIIAVPIMMGSQGYLDWIEEVTAV